MAAQDAAFQGERVLQELAGHEPDRNPTAFPGACGALPQGTTISSPLQLDFAIAPPPTPISELGAKLGPVALNPAAFTATAPGTCPSGFDKLTNGVYASKGEFYCMKQWQPCPTGYTQGVNDNTGQITCTPNTQPTCPTGWSGGVGNGGVLTCQPNPLPTIACGDSPMKAQGWYLNFQKMTNPNWNRMGCFALEQLK
jgi:hypothetical protein